MDYYVMRIVLVAALVAACEGGADTAAEPMDGGLATDVAPLVDVSPAADTGRAPDGLLPPSDGHLGGAGGAAGSSGTAGAGGAGGSSPAAGAGGAAGAPPLAGSGGSAPMGGAGGQSMAGAGGSSQDPDPTISYCPQHPGLTYSYCGFIGPYGEYDGEIGYRQVARYKSGYACGTCRADGNKQIVGCLMDEAPSPNSIGIDVPTLCVAKCGECCYREPAPCATDADCCAPLTCKSGRCG